MKDWYTGISGKVMLLSQKPHTISQIDPIRLNQYSLLDHSKVLKITPNYESNIKMKTGNDKNPKIQKTYLTTCMQEQGSYC